MRRREAMGMVGTFGVGLLAGCGRGISGPSSSDGPLPVSVVSGRTGFPIPSYSGLTATVGQSLTLQASGFFSFETTFTGQIILLWPADDGFLLSHHSRRLVYRGENPGQLRRLPLTVTQMSLIPDEGIRAFPWAMDRLRRSTEVLSNAHPALNFDVDGYGFPISLSVNFADPGFVIRPEAAALAYTSSDALGVITGVRIVVRSLQIQGFWYSENNFQCAMTHECLHGTGLDHSDDQDPPGIMLLGSDSYRYLEPSVQERLIMTMHYERLPGTVLHEMTERDPTLAAKSGLEKQEWQLVCAT